MKKFGELDIEKKATDILRSREIVKTIMDYGVSQQQILRIAYLLCLELENREMMISTSECIKQHIEEISSEKCNNIIV